MSVVIRHLYENPELLPEVGDWIYQAFWTDQPGVTVDDLNERLQEAVNRESVPLSLVAFLNDKPVGTVNLIESDDDTRPHLKPWLAALYVKPEVRSQGVGAKLVLELLVEAKRLGLSTVYLWTERPDFYAKLGASIHEMASPTFSIMSFNLAKQ